MELFRGYVPTKNKKCLMKFKDGAPLMSYDQVKDLPEYAGILGDETILIDIDDKDQSEILMNIVEDLQLNCRVYQTTRGKHFLFKNSNVSTCGTHCKLAIGLEADIKIGTKNSYSVLKFNDEERFIEWDSETYDLLPKWLLRIKTNTDFVNMNSGDGRNQALFNYILNLQQEGFTKKEARECITLINKYVFKDKLSDKELDVILRDDAFNKPIFFEKTTFLFDKFSKYLVNEYHIVKINNVLHIFKDGVYVNGDKKIESIMISLIPNLKDTQRKEVLKYLDLVAPVKDISDANYIAFNNGVYNLVTDTLEPYTPDIVITNKIPWNYDVNAYNEVADRTLNKIACNDVEIRALLEEYIGYNFYRRNELGKAFIFLGDKSNGKSTFLDVVGKLLGEENTSALDIKELGDRFSTAMLFGKLGNIGDDIGDDFLQGTAISIFKKVVTGNRLKAELKGRDPFEFNPYVKLTFSANEMPKMKDRTGAVIRRLVAIPCNARFTKEDADYDPFIKYKLIERSSIEYLIKIGIIGLRRVLANNSFTESKASNESLKDYELENDTFLQFIQDLDIDDFVNKVTSDIYLQYTSSFTGMQQPVNKFAFSKRICKTYNLCTINKKIDGKVYTVFARKK